MKRAPLRVGEMWRACLQAYAKSTRQQCLCNYSHCQKGETNDPYAGLREMVIQTVTYSMTVLELGQEIQVL